jgi:hypothetical protein
MTTMNDNDPRQSLALIEEVVTAVNFLKVGIGGLEEPEPLDDAYQIILQNLASGFERLLKIVLIFHAMVQTGRVSTRPWPQSVNGHDVVALLDLVVTRCYAHAFYPAQAPAIVEDEQYLRTDPTLRELMAILAHHGMAGRYHDLDTALGRPPGSDTSPIQELDHLELEIIMRDFPDWAERMGAGVAGVEMEKAARRRLAADCRRAARALARLFTLSPLAPVASPLTSVIGPFLYLRDEDLNCR